MKKNKVIINSFITLLTVSTLGGIVSNADVVGTAGSKGSVRFTADSGNTQPKPYDPTDPGTPPKDIDPSNPGEGGGTVGLLRFDRVPNFAFEDLVVSNKTVTSNVLEEKYKLTVAPTDPAEKQEYYAAPTVEITDLRGTNKGWSASVKIDEKFVDSADPTSTFVGEVTLQQGRVAAYTEQDASLYPTTPTDAITLNQTEQEFVSAADGKGAYQWGISYYTGDHANQGKPKKNYTSTPIADAAVQLKVKPGQKVNLDSVYKTNLTWTLTDA